MRFIQSAVLCTAGSLLIASAALADAQSTYKSDRAACMKGQSGQDRTTCLKEASAALAEAKRGHLDDRQAEYDRNRLARCDSQPAQDRDECVRRMNEGTTSGSVQGGGVSRELVTPVR